MQTLGNLIVAAVVTEIVLTTCVQGYQKIKAWTGNGVDTSRTRNQRLDVLRHKTHKTVEEQKEFVTLKFEREGRWFEWRKNWKIILLSTASAIFIYMLIYGLFGRYNVQITIWQAVIVVFCLPVVWTLVLRLFKVRRDNMLLDILGW